MERKKFYPLRHQSLGRAGMELKIRKKEYIYIYIYYRGKSSLIIPNVMDKIRYHITALKFKPLNSAAICD